MLHEAALPYQLEPILSQTFGHCPWHPLPTPFSDSLANLHLALTCLPFILALIHLHLTACSQAAESMVGICAENHRVTTKAFFGHATSRTMATTSRAKARVPRGLPDPARLR